MVREYCVVCFGANGTENLVCPDCAAEDAVIPHDPDQPDPPDHYDGDY